MRKIDKILMTLLFVVVLGRLVQQLLFGADDEIPILRTPLVVQPAIEAPRSEVSSTLPDSHIAPAKDIPNSTSTGSAFALSRTGHWGTATHVTAQCKSVFVAKESGVGFRYVPVKRWRTLKGMDVAVMDSAQGEPGLTLASSLPKPNDLGFFFGYPRGKASAGYAAHLGRSRMIREKGRVKELGDEWAIYEMLPGKQIVLGGNSGGPMLNDQGAVVGVVSAGSDRRGRVLTSIIPNLVAIEFFSSPEHEPRMSLSPDNYVDYGKSLRRQGLVTKVICQT